MKLKKYNFIVRMLYFVSILSWFFFDYLSPEKYNDNIKYIIMLLNMALIIFILSKNNVLKIYKNVDRDKNVKLVFKTGIILLLISYIFQLVNFKFSMMPLKQFFYIFVPILFVDFFFKCNTSEKDCDFFFNLMFIIAVVTFLIKASDILNINNIKQISFTDSYSPFESIGMADIFLLLYCWFISRKHFFSALISAGICFLTFKRFHVVFMLVFLIICMLRNKGKKIDVNKTNKLLKRLFYFAPILMLFLYSEKFMLFFNSRSLESYNQVTMGRYRIVNIVLDSYKNGDFINLGLGSTGEFLRTITGGYIANMHCDVLRLVIETTYIGYLILVNNYFKLVRDKNISLYILCFMFIVMTISHNMTSFIGWVITYMFIYSEERNIYD